MRASDRRAKFIGLEACELAGRAAVRDLFDPEAVYVEDPALMAQLAEKKLEGERNSWLAQGRGWVENSLGQGRADGAYAARDGPVRAGCPNSPIVQKPAPEN